MQRGIRDVRLPRVHRVTKNGKVYRWHRHTRVKLPDDLPETHPDFIAAWANAEALGGKAPSRTPAGTIVAEIEAMLATAQFRVSPPPIGMRSAARLMQSETLTPKRRSSACANITFLQIW